MTATLVHTSSREDSNRLAIARVAAGARTARDAAAVAKRDARRTRETLRAARAWVESLRSAGAVRVGFKVITEDGKYRMVLPISQATTTLALRHDDEVEAWGIDAEGEYVGEPW